MTALTWGQRRDNLPAEVNRFVGRRRELPAIGEALERHRLVTLRGPGGVGKTRLALHAAAGLRDTFADGCWLVQLSPLRAPELLPRAVSEALGLPDDGTGDPARALAESLAERELLLILDTCEHLTAGCAELAARLLAAAPRLRILATSRAALAAPGEHSLLIGPLELPADDASATRADAVSLFVDRAHAAVPDFALTKRNTPAVAELCRRLDGMPLALELAAVRLRGMPVEELLIRVGDRFRALGTARTAVERHRTLRATVAWSHELCTPAEQRLWAELSVFPGSFCLAAAQRVCGPGAGETLGRLADKSVVQFSAGAPSFDGGRYQMLDTMREFGAELLGKEATRRVRARHRDYFLELAERAAVGSMTAKQAGWLGCLGVQTANLRAALGFSFTEPGEAPAGLRMTRLLLPYWQMTGQFTEGRRWHALALAVNPGSADHAWAVFGAGVLAVLQGDLARGGPLLTDAAALAGAARDENLAAHVTDARGVLALRAGKLATARACHEAALASYQRIGFADPTALASYGRLSAVYLQSNEPDRAARFAEECLRRCAELGEQWARGTALVARGGARWRTGDYLAAIEDTLACLRIKEELGDLHTIAICFDLLTTCLVSTGDVERAAVLRGAADTLWKLLNAPVLVGPAYTQIRESHGAAARAALGEERFAALLRHGAALPLPAALATARGEAPVVPAGSPLAVTGAGPGGAPGSAARPLTRREREIAGLVADGLGNREIAGRLFLSKRTVDSHIEHIFAKLSFSSRAQLAGWFREQGQAGLAGTVLTDTVLTDTVLTCAVTHYISIFIKIGGSCHPCRHQSFTGGRQSLRMSDDSGSGWSRRQVIAAGTTGLIAATAAAPSRGMARGRSGPRDGTPEQIHLTWGDDLARTVVVSWASAGRADRPRVRIGQRVIAATERACADPRSGDVTWTYHARVDGLRPGATYGYAVTADNDASGADPFSATFTTAPEGRAAFRFTSFGDLGTARAGTALESGQAAYAAGAVETFQPLFHLDNGDLTPASPAPGALAQAWRDFGINVQASAANRPWLPVPGDHALGAGDGEQGLASFLARYTLPANGMAGLEGRWYAFRVGTALFVCLSGDDVAYQDMAAPDAAGGRAAVPYSGRGYSDGAQTRWLESTLAAARGDASLDWVIVALHQCACSSTAAGIGSDLGIRREWLPLFDTYEVDLVLSGHDHGYERSFPVRGQDAAGRPHPVTTVDSGVFDTSQGAVHLVLGCAGTGAGPGPGTDGVTGSDGVAEAATCSARRDASPGYGIAVFDVNPGSEAGGQTSISARYYHDFRDYRASGTDPVSPVAGEPDGDYAFFETFTLVRPRSDGRRWHLKD